MPASPNHDFSARVRRTLDDLALIRHTLLADSEPTPDTVITDCPALDVELASELKSVVDELRQLLWAYSRALSSKSGCPPNELLNWYKMDLAVQMLRSVGARTKANPASDGEPVFSFEELVSDAMAVTSFHTDNKPVI
jgi:hypothetical protein